MLSSTSTKTPQPPLVGTIYGCIDSSCRNWTLVQLAVVAPIIHGDQHFIQESCMQEHSSEAPHFVHVAGAGKGRFIHRHAETGSHNTEGQQKQARRSWRGPAVLTNAGQVWRERNQEWNRLIAEGMKG